MKIVLGILVGVVALAALIVVVRVMSTQTQPRYDIYLANRTHHDLQDLYVYFDNRVVTGKGILVKGGKFGHLYIKLPVPAEADVRWVEQKTPHAVKVKLEGIVPPQPRDMIVWFLIEEDGSVTAKYTGKHDEAAIGELLRSLPPPEQVK